MLLVKLFVIVLSIVCIIYAFTNAKEHFVYPLDSKDYNPVPNVVVDNPINNLTLETPLTPKVEATYLQYENTRCSHLVDPYQDPTDADHIDVLKRYRFLKHPDDSDKCYFKMNDSLVAGNCSTLNSALYDNQFSDVVKNIGTEKLNDPEVAKTLKHDLCTVTFNDSATVPRKLTYANYIDNNDPVTIGLRKQEQIEEANIARLKQDIQDLNSKIQAEQNVIAAENTTIAQNNQTLAKQVKDIAYNTDTNKILTNEYAKFNDGTPDDNQSGTISAETASQCRYLNTGWQRIFSDWDTNEMSKMPITCAGNEYVSKISMETKYSPSWARYFYKCCKLNPKITDAKPKDVIAYTGWNQAGNWDLPYLDRHSLNCGDQGLINAVTVQAKNKPNNNIQYMYSCLNPNIPNEDRPSTICSDFTTPPTGISNNFNHLDNHNVDCPDGQGLSALQLQVTDDRRNIYYKYRCCSTMLNQPGIRP